MTNNNKKEAQEKNGCRTGCMILIAFVIILFSIVIFIIYWSTSEEGNVKLDLINGLKSLGFALLSIALLLLVSKLVAKFRRLKRK